MRLGKRPEQGRACAGAAEAQHRAGRLVEHGGQLLDIIQPEAVRSDRDRGIGKARLFRGLADRVARRLIGRFAIGAVVDHRDDTRRLRAGDIGRFDLAGGEETIGDRFEFTHAAFSLAALVMAARFFLRRLRWTMLRISTPTEKPIAA